MFFAALALILVTLGLNLPNSVDELMMPTFWSVPVELLLAAGVVVLAGRRADPVLARIFSGILALMILVRVVDRLVWLWFGRELVLVADAELVVPLLEVTTAGWRYLPLAALVAIVASTALLLAWPVRHGLSALTRLPRAVALIPLVLAATWFIGGPVSVFGIDQVGKQATRYAYARAAKQRFDAARAQDPWRKAPTGKLFPQLRGVDVLVVFVESYGRSSFDQPDLAAVVGPSLTRLADAATTSGRTLLSGYVRSPTLGGQSWLAHATLASGIKITEQGGWRIYLQEADADLAHLFRRAGHATFEVEPAIVHPFPEAARLGFDRSLFADELDYHGPRPGYVTMPDQFTLSRVEEVLSASSDQGSGSFGQIVLIGSHAPFTPPVPLVVPWASIGDGRVFAGKIPPGPTPARLWSDAGKLRAAYADQIAATLDVLASWTALPAMRPRLVIMVGDHEPAARVVGGDPGHDVPVHILATSPDLATPFRKAGFVDGPVPDPSAPLYGMEDLRGILLDGFGDHALPKIVQVQTDRQVE